MKKITVALIVLFTAFTSYSFITDKTSATSQETGLLIGNLAPELKFKSPEGKEIPLSSLRGSYVLIDFWASWCGPCRRENPTLVQAFTKYKTAKFKNTDFKTPKGSEAFKIYSVSLDRDHNSWVNAIKQDGLTWPYHVSD